MSQPEVRLYPSMVPDLWYMDITKKGGNQYVVIEAKTKKTAYKRAAAKLRKLADEAERLANE